MHIDSTEVIERYGLAAFWWQLLLPIDRVVNGKIPCMKKGRERERGRRKRGKKGRRKRERKKREREREREEREKGKKNFWPFPTYTKKSTFFLKLC